MKYLLLLAIGMGVAFPAWPETGAAAAPAAGKTVLLFSFFRDNGQDGLYLATSEDGLKWAEIKPPGKSFLQPKLADKLMRDPCLALGPDGTFHMTWTCGWGKPAVIGLAHSKDLVNWSGQKALPVMASEPDANNAWAPEIYYHAAEKDWILFWSTTIPGKFPETANSGDNNHRIYCTTTKDFETYTPTRLFYDGGFNVIDATMLPAKGKFHLVVKDETRNPVKKHLRLAVGDSPAGPFGPAGVPFTTNWVEGPSAIAIDGEYYVYFDHYTNPEYYGATRSKDLVNWEDVSTRVSFPRGSKHGTVLRVPETVVRHLQSLQTSQTNQP